MFVGSILYAKDFRVLASFYAALVDGCTAEMHDDYAALKSGESQMIVLQIPEHLSTRIKIKRPPQIRASTPLKPIVRVSSLPDALGALDALGGTVRPGSPQWEFQGNLVQDIVDPEGNVVQLWQSIDE